MFRLHLVLLLILGLLAGCGEVVVFGHTIGEKSPVPEVVTESSGANAPSMSAASAPASVSTAKAVASATVQRVRAVTLSLTPDATAKVANDPRFTADALLAAVKSELQSRKLLDETDARAAATAEISIDDFAVRPTSNAVIFGRIISAGRLNGDIRVRDADDKDLRSFKVEAASQVSIAASGDTPNPLGALYHRFAVLAADRLAGVASRPEQAADQHYR